MDDYIRLMVTNSELDYRNELFDGDYATVLDFNAGIKCSVCEAKVNWMMLMKNHIIKHPIMEVILCEACYEPHKSNDWSEGCLWCGLKKSDSEMVICGQCPTEFCKKCIEINFGLNELMRALIDSDWKCFICNQKVLWGLRAICDAAEKVSAKFREAEKSSLRDVPKECASCKVEFQKTTKLHCGHKFHFECFSRWSNKSSVCPLCRAIVPK